MRPFISALGSATVVVASASTCEAAQRCTASATIRAAKVSPCSRAARARISLRASACVIFASAWRRASAVWFSSRAVFAAASAASAFAAAAPSRASSAAALRSRFASRCVCRSSAACSSERRFFVDASNASFAFTTAARAEMSASFRRALMSASASSSLSRMRFSMDSACQRPTRPRRA